MGGGGRVTIMQGQKFGSWVGVVAGLAFVAFNVGGLPDPWPVLLWIAGLVAAAFVAVVIVRAPAAHVEPPSRQAIRVYGWCVTAMIVAIPLGASLLNGPLDAPELTVVWVVAVVGAHFLPFASAFEAPVFRSLAWTLLAVAAAGAAATLLIGKGAAPATAVVAGFVLLGFAALGARSGGAGIRSRSPGGGRTPGR
jgi:hypothetical protein